MGRLTSLLSTEASGVWTQWKLHHCFHLTKCLNIHLNICSYFGEFTEALVEYEILNVHQQTTIVWTDTFCWRSFWHLSLSVMQPCRHYSSNTVRHFFNSTACCEKTQEYGRNEKNVLGSGQWIKIMSHLEDKSLPPQCYGQAIQFELSFMVKELKEHFLSLQRCSGNGATVDAEMQRWKFSFPNATKTTF